MLREPHGEGTDMYEEQALHTWSPALEWAAPQPAATMPDAVRRCRDLADAIGADGFGLFFMASEGEARRLVPVFDSAFPGVSPASRTLSARGADGLARRAAGSAQPLWWAGAGGGPVLHGDARLWAAEVENPAPSPLADERPGILFPVAQENGRSGAVAFFGPDMLLGEDALCETHARCYALFAEVARQRPLDGGRLPAMSKREIECLRLTANGFTSDEIAGALGLSVHTANQYLTSSAHKLNAVNRIHAVAKALRVGLID
jgi:DNA-binding CsgD family transcriptional regulator